MLCAVDWVGIGNGGYDAFREALAKAAGTSVDRVALHTLHQHDAPSCDFDAEALLASRSLGGAMFHVAFARQTIDRAAAALRQSLSTPKDGDAPGHRRGPRRESRLEPPHPGRGRQGASTSATARARFPRPSRRPKARSIRTVRCSASGTATSRWSCSATTPRIRRAITAKGGVSYDFVGMARAQREAALPGVPHIHFNGASGNVAAGKVQRRLAGQSARCWPRGWPPA